MRRARARIVLVFLGLLFALPVDKLLVVSNAALKIQPPSAREEVHYPIEEKVGQDSLQVAILELLRPLIERWFLLLGKPTFVGADQFIYWKRGYPSKVVAPDVYVLPGVAPGTRVKSWKVWQTGIVPSLAIEVVASDDPYKDYMEGPERYGQLGVEELIIFDVNWESGEDRLRWQRYRRLKTRGFSRVDASDGDRVRSRVLGCFLRVVGEGDGARLRLGIGPGGDELLPTEAEAERAAKEAERAAKETERAAKEAALRKVAELEAQLAKRRS